MHPVTLLHTTMVQNGWLVSAIKRLPIILLLVPWKIQSFQNLLLNWARVVFGLLSRILLVDFSPHATEELFFYSSSCLLLKISNYVSALETRYISVESIRNKILISMACPMLVWLKTSVASKGGRTVFEVT